MTATPCAHEDVNLTDVGDVLDYEPGSGVYRSVDGVCSACGASMTGTARQTSPDGDYEDHEWQEA